MFRGLRQGDGLSCLLFICVLSVIFYDAERAWKQAGAHITDRDRVIEAFGREIAKYADDSNLFSCDPAALQIVLHELQREARRYGLELSIDKTWLILVGAARDNPPALTDLDGRPVRVTDSHRTLGFSVGQTSRTSAQVRQRGGSMLSTMNQYKLVWRSTLSLKQKVDRYFSLVVAKGIWGLHLLTLLPADFSYLEYIHARCLRRILGIRAAYYSRVSNDAVRRRANAPRLEATIRRRQLLFLGSTLRRAEDHPDRLACFQPGSDLRPRVPQRAKRRRGAPRKVWAETILPLCEQRWNKSRADILQLAQNPREWNIAIDNFCRQIG